jgi:hypothetical protein
VVVVCAAARWPATSRAAKSPARSIFIPPEQAAEPAARTGRRARATQTSGAITVLRVLTRTAGRQNHRRPAATSPPSPGPGHALEKQTPSPGRLRPRHRVLNRHPAANKKNRLKPQFTRPPGPNARSTPRRPFRGGQITLAAIIVGLLIALHWRSRAGGQGTPVGRAASVISRLASANRPYFHGHHSLQQIPAHLQPSTPLETAITHTATPAGATATDATGTSSTPTSPSSLPTPSGHGGQSAADPGRNHRQPATVVEPPALTFANRRPISRTAAHHRATGRLREPRAICSSDETIPDGTQLAPGELFEKVWRLQNADTCPLGTWLHHPQHRRRANGRRQHCIPLTMLPSPLIAAG